MKIKNLFFQLVSILLIIFLSINSYGQHRKQDQQYNKIISVVSSLPCYASIAEYIGGDLVTVNHIASGNQDPHFVQPKPSYANIRIHPRHLAFDADRIPYFIIFECQKLG